MPADTCGACHHTLHGAKESIRCIGPCAAHYHLRCAKIDVSEREFYFIDGDSTYKCHSCTRRGSNDVCVTPIPSQRNFKTMESSSHQDECIESHFESVVNEKLHLLKEDCDSLLLLQRKLVNEVNNISAELNLLRSDNAAFMNLLSEHFKESNLCSYTKSNSTVMLTERIQSSSESETFNDIAESSPTSPKNILTTEDLCLKIVHREIRKQKSDFLSPFGKSDGDNSTEKLLKIEAHSNSEVSTVLLKPKMKNLCVSSFPPELKKDELLLKEMTVSRTFPWKLGSFLLLLAIAGLLSYDIRKHGSFRSSSTGLFLNDVGALQYGEDALTRTKFYSSKSVQWAEANVPHYYKVVVEHVKPYLELTWDICLVLGHQVHYMYENIHLYVEEKTPIVIEWVNYYAPGLLEKVKLHSIEAWEVVKENATLLSQNMLQYSYMGVEWAKTNVFVGNLSPENLQKYSMDALNTTQVYAVWTYDWVCRKVQTLSKIQ